MMADFGVVATRLPLARVNRVFRDKPGGLVVDYLGLADQLKRPLATYTESGGHGQAADVLDPRIASHLQLPLDRLQPTTISRRPKHEA